MGFGILFIGYIITFIFSLNPYGYVAELIGYIFMLAALCKLAPYSKNFRYAKYTAFPSIAIFAFLSFAQIAPKLGFEVQFDFINVVNVIMVALVFIYHYFLLFGIRDIAKETEIVKIKEKSVRNFIVGVFYYVLTVISYLPFSFRENFIKYFGLSVTLFGFVWFVMNIILIYSCYMWICLEGDEDMECKKSRFAFVNKLRDDFNRKEEENVRSSIDYIKSKRKKKK